MQLWTGEQYVSAQVESAYPGRQHPWFLTLITALFVLVFMIGFILLTINISELMA